MAESFKQFVARIYRVTKALIDERPWDVIREAMDRHFVNLSWKELYL